MTKIRPLNNYILIEPISEEITQSGIYMPGNNKKKILIGTVLEVCAESPVTPQNRVYHKKGGESIRIDGRDLILIKAEDCLAVIEGDI